MSVMNPDARPIPLRDANDLAEQLGMSISSVYRKRSLGEPLPPALKIGSQVRWRQSDIDAWLLEQMENAS